MEPILSKEFETIHDDSSPSSESSFLGNTDSLKELNSDDFYELCKARLKICKQNTALLLKLK